MPLADAPRKRLALAIVVVVMRTRAARAEPVHLLHLDYRAPGNCPTAAEFERRVGDRTPLAQFSDDDDAEPVRVRVDPLGTTYAGHLSVGSVAGHPTERTVEDALCADVVDALALVTALAVDPLAGTAVGSAPRSPSPAPSAQAAPALPLPEGTISPGGLVAEPGRPPAGPMRHDALRSERSATTLTPGWAPRFGAGVTTEFGVAPDVLAGGAAFAELESRSPGWLVPSMRLTFDAAENGAFASRTASFALITGQADVCPARLGAALSLRPCAAVQLGALRGEGILVAHPDVAVDFWAAAALLARARWAPGRPPLFAELEGGLGVPFTRPMFAYRLPYAFVDQPFALTGTATLALGVHFP